MAAIPAEINPALLIWAREQSGYSPELVAKRLDVKLYRLEAWEHGERKPTVRQVQELAKYYHRPFGVFFLPQPPTIQPLAAEYRRLPGVRPGVESPQFRYAFRVMSQRREVALELNEELGVSVPEFSTAAHIAEGPAAVGTRLRALLGLTVEEQLGWRDEWQAWRRWRSAVEDTGVLVFQFPKVPLDEARGVSILQFPLPAVGVNSKEWAPGARIFTLLHELTHVALSLGREEEVALRERRDDAEWAEVEQFAEEAASEAIIPGDALATVRRTVPGSRDAWDRLNVRALTNRFRVTPLAMATRLRRAGAMTWDDYRRWKAAWTDYISSLKPRKGGFASPVDKTLGRGGRPFAQLVIEALDSNRITAVDASRYLDLRFDHIEKLRTELHSDTAGAGIDDGA
ncbi:MAG: helix-turn-helix domain-containing protein [Acidobacteria bacterium]|nr:helix-turn-helix domain-containing protein [Acidobacteriota bacterium]